MTKRTCAAADCAKVYYCRGYCVAHYQRWKKTGDPFGSVPRKTQGECKVADCRRTSVAHNLCDPHYRRVKNFGDLRADTPLAVSYVDPAEAFRARTERTADGCLAWTGTMAGGYGQMVVGGESVPAHRYAWEQANGAIPDGHEIDHTCYRKECVEASHLRPALRSENSWNLSGATARSGTGVRNVFETRSGFRVRVVRNGVRHNGGTYLTIDEAARVAEALRAELFGEFQGRG